VAISRLKKGKKMASLLAKTAPKKLSALRETAWEACFGGMAAS